MNYRVNLIKVLYKLKHFSHSLSSLNLSRQSCRISKLNLRVLAMKQSVTIILKKPIETLSIDNIVIGFEYCEDVAGVNLIWQDKTKANLCWSKVALTKGLKIILMPDWSEIDKIVIIYKKSDA